MNRFRLLALGALALAPLSAPLSAQTPRPRVLVVGTGGTIGSSGGYWVGNNTRVPIDQVVRVSGIDSVARIESEQYLNVGSTSIGPDRWLALSRHIASRLSADTGLAGVVVTHGTDTMEETAYFLDLTLPAGRPVIVTGSMRPSDMAGADGPANLTASMRLATTPSARNRGVMVVMDDRAHAARRVTKTNTTRVETFESPEYGPLAILDPEAISFHQPADRHGTTFDLSGITQLPRVDIIYVYPGADSVLIDAAVAAGAKGLVVAGAGRGGYTGEQGRALARAMAQGVTVVVSSRTGSGSVPVGTGSGRQFGAGDLNPQKARVLLMLALSRTQQPDELRAIFSAAR